MQMYKIKMKNNRSRTLFPKDEKETTSEGALLEWKTDGIDKQRSKPQIVENKKTDYRERS